MVRVGVISAALVLAACTQEKTPADAETAIPYGGADAAQEGEQGSPPSQTGPTEPGGTPNGAGADAPVAPQ